MTACAGSAVLAYETHIVPAIDAGRELSLTVSYRHQHDGNTVMLHGAEFRVCRVSDLSVKYGSATYGLLADFSETGISLEGMTAAQSHDAAAKLYDVAKKKDLAMLKRTTDASGRALFTGLAPGMYLVVQPSPHKQNDRTYVSEPFLVSVPLAMPSGNGNEWQYSVTVCPKNATSVPVKKPPQSKPKTGDLMLFGFWGCVLIISSIGLRAVFLEKRKKRTTGHSA